MLVGPSGAGKTTAMKLVNRLIDFDEGDITIDGRSVRSLDAVELRRGIGYVIQQVGLFPHMTVGDNVGVVPRLLGWPKKRDPRARRRAARARRARGRATATAIPSQLSGGQRQRVGLARALAADPKVMLMDEPFGALDPITRDRLQNEFLRLHEVERKTVIFVTHDIDEAIKLGDRIAILREGGVLAQYDTPDAILAAPADEFVAQLRRRRPRAEAAGAAAPRRDRARLAERHPADAPRTSLQTTLRDALSLMLTEGAERLVVVDDDGRRRGRPLRRARQPAARGEEVVSGGPPAAGHPELRAAASDVRARTTTSSARTGCSEHWGDTLQPALVDHVKLTAIAVGIGFVHRLRGRARRAPVPLVRDSRSALFARSSTRSRASRSSSCSCRSPG